MGLTLGTGFCGGMVSNGELWIGDNSAGAEINRMSQPFNSAESVEEIISIRGIRRLYCEFSGEMPENCPEPADLFKIAEGSMDGNKNAASRAWKYFGEVLGNAMANAATLTDSMIVIGGGLSGAWPVFLQTAVDTMNSKFKKHDGTSLPRMEVYAYNLHNPNCLADFLQDEGSGIRGSFFQRGSNILSGKKNRCRHKYTRHL